MRLGPAAILRTGVRTMSNGSDRHACLAALHRLYGATNAYRHELERARPAAERMGGLGDERAVRALDSIVTSLDTAAPQHGSVVHLEQVLRECLFVEVAAGRVEQRP